jgi:hypothetical protein
MNATQQRFVLHREDVELVSQPRAAGEQAGHEFHGNQWNEHNPWPLEDHEKRELTPGTWGDMRQYVPWKKSLTKEESNAITRYTSGGSIHVNTYLRELDNPDISPEARSSIFEHDRAALLSAALAKAPPVPDDLIVWRGAFPGAMDGVKTGDTIRLPGFQSASIDPWLAQRWQKAAPITFEIRPTTGVYIEALSKHKGEFEFLMPHDAQYRVIGTKDVEISKSHRSSAGGEGGTSVRKTVVQLEMLPYTPPSPEALWPHAHVKTAASVGELDDFERFIQPANAVIVVKRLRTAGDVSGHAFHGNQWLHGTAQEHIAAILREGIRSDPPSHAHTTPVKGLPLAKPGHVYLTADLLEAQRYAEMASLDSPSEMVDPVFAKSFGSMEPADPPNVQPDNGQIPFYLGGTEVGGHMPAVVTVQLPTSAVRQLTVDKRSDILTDIMKPGKRVISKVARSYKGDIPPEWISSISYQTRNVLTREETWHTVTRDNLKDFKLPHGVSTRGAEATQTFYVPMVIGATIRTLGDKEGHDFHGNQWGNTRGVIPRSDGADREGSSKDDQRAAIGLYQSMDYVAINNTLRGTYDYASDAHAPNSKEVIKAVYALDDAISAEPPLSAPITIFRGVNSGVLPDEVAVGDQFIDHGFGSASSDVSVATRFGHQLIQIEIPAGTRVLDVRASAKRQGQVPWEEDEIPKRFRDITHSYDDPVVGEREFNQWKERYYRTHNGESETIIPRDAKFEITKVARGSQYDPQIYMRMIS